jgi:hypothetical protein
MGTGVAQGARQRQSPSRSNARDVRVGWPPGPHVQRSWRRPLGRPVACATCRGQSARPSGRHIANVAMWRLSPEAGQLGATAVLVSGTGTRPDWSVVPAHRSWKCVGCGAGARARRVPAPVLSPPRSRPSGAGGAPCRRTARLSGQPCRGRVRLLVRDQEGAPHGWSYDPRLATARIARGGGCPLPVPVSQLPGSPS